MTKIVSIFLLFLSFAISVNAQKDSIIIKGQLIAIDSTNIAELSNRYLSVSNIRFQVAYQELDARTDEPMIFLSELTTDAKGYFELKTPKIEAIVFNFHFLKGNFIDTSFIFMRSENNDRLSLVVKSSIKVIRHLIIVCPGPSSNQFSPNANKRYNSKQIEQRGIDNILKDVY